MSIEITSHEELASWLDDKPREWGQVIALRTALRVFPFSFDPASYKEMAMDAGLPLAVIRALCLAVGFRRISTDRHEPFDPVTRAAHGAHKAAEVATRANNRIVFGAIASVAFATEAGHINEALLAVRAARQAVESAASAGSLVWDQVSHDCTHLQDGGLTTEPADKLFWDKRPDWFEVVWGRAAKWLSRPEDGFEIWREWYYGRLEGLSHAFADFDDEADEEFFRWIGEQDDDWWKREPREVNADIKAKVEELRKPPPPADTELQQEPSVVNYVVDDEGTVQLAPEPLPNGVQDDQDNQDNYGEIKRLIEEALDECDPSKTQDKSMAPATQQLQASLGSDLSHLSPRLFVLRAKEVIRRFEARQAGEAMIPLSQGQIDAFSPLIEALQTLAEFDPKLAQIWARSREGPARFTRDQLETLILALAQVKQMSPEAQQTAETYLAQVDSDAGPDDPELKKANDNVGNAFKAMGKAVKKGDEALKTTDRAIRVAEKGSKIWEMVRGKIPDGETITNILDWLSKIGGPPVKFVTPA